jgi:hypothetical protein
MHFIFGVVVAVFAVSTSFPQARTGGGNMLSEAKAFREKAAEAKMRKELEDVRLRLHNLIQGDKSRLSQDEVYRLSSQLDTLIVQYMRWTS